MRSVKPLLQNTRVRIQGVAGALSPALTTYEWIRQHFASARLVCRRGSCGEPLGGSPPHDKVAARSVTAYRAQPTGDLIDDL
jgi:hypothetical protein